MWQTGLSGLDWIDKLVADGRAIALTNGGYPSRFCAPASEILTRIVDGPPNAAAVWRAASGDVLLANWEGETVVDRAAVAACGPDDWLLVEAWDES